MDYLRRLHKKIPIIYPFTLLCYWLLVAELSNLYYLHEGNDIHEGNISSKSKYISTPIILNAIMITGILISYCAFIFIAAAIKYSTEFIKCSILFFYRDLKKNNFFGSYLFIDICLYLIFMILFESSKKIPSFIELPVLYQGIIAFVEMAHLLILFIGIKYLFNSILHP